MVGTYLSPTLGDHAVLYLVVQQRHRHQRPLEGEGDVERRLSARVGEVWVGAAPEERARHCAQQHHGDMLWGEQSNMRALGRECAWA